MVMTGVICLSLCPPEVNEHFHSELFPQLSSDYLGFVVVVCRAMLLQLFYHDKLVRISQRTPQSAERKVFGTQW